MKKMLGRKQTSPNSRWIEAVDRIEELVTIYELDRAVATTVESIKDTIQGKNVVFAWSGGKDSIVLADICKKIGITACMFAYTDLEYPAFLDWCMKNQPEGCEDINLGFNLEWLAKHEEMIFPKGKNLNRWYQIVQRAAFTKYFFAHKLDLILVGHRKADGNFVGPNGILRKSCGEVRYSPLADWSHEMILAYIHYHGLSMPPIYDWENGYRCGTHPWPSRMYVDSIEQGYREVYRIDPSIIEKAAEVIPSASHFLREEVTK